MPLTDTALRAAKVGDKQRRLADERGLYVLLHPNGAKYWRLKYRFGGKQKTLALGVYPEISLREARERRDQARKLLAHGTDPAEVKRAEKQAAAEVSASCFRNVALEWISKQSTRWSEGHARRVEKSLEDHIFPALGDRPVEEITAQELLRVLRVVEGRGTHETSMRLLQRCDAAFRYGVVTGRCDRSPAGDLKGALTPPKRENYAALGEADLPEFFAKLAEYDGHMQTRLAIRLLMLTCVRTGELRQAEWGEFVLDGDAPTWRIPAARMKMRSEHIVPLSRQAAAALRELHALTGRGRLVFPGQRDTDRPMSENTILFGLYRMGYHSRATGHGFRSTFSTIANESGKWSPDAIERQLAHAERNQVRAAYHRSEYLAERRRLMQWWGDYLDRLRVGGEVVRLRRSAS
ncbi:MAG: integrase arm-type DNA-binding domain-containing protein [Nitrospirae bacterium]|nr:integrase arm-type DNA-binding domain-containing protein [Nitrospirota bacterium]